MSVLKVASVFEFEKVLRGKSNKLFYPKSEVDAAIAELKDKCQMHDFFWDGCGFAKRGFKNSIAVSEAFDNLEAENKRLKGELSSLQNKACEDVFEGISPSHIECPPLRYAKEKLCATQRALWLARAERAMAESYSVLNDVCTTNKWAKILNKLKAKAEEFV